MSLALSQRARELGGRFRQLLWTGRPVEGEETNKWLHQVKGVCGDAKHS